MASQERGKIRAAIAKIAEHSHTGRFFNKMHIISLVLGRYRKNGHKTFLKHENPILTKETCLLGPEIGKSAYN